MTEMLYNHCDKNHDGMLSWTEARKCDVPIKFGAQFIEAAGDDGLLSQIEFLLNCKDNGGGVTFSSVNDAVSLLSKFEVKEKTNEYRLTFTFAILIMCLISFIVAKWFFNKNQKLESDKYHLIRSGSSAVEQV